MSELVIGRGLASGPRAEGLLLGLFAEGGFAITSDDTVADNGGEIVTVGGPFDDESYTVTVGGEAAYSGVSGQGGVCAVVSGSLSFVVPSGLPVGFADVVLTGSTQTITFSDGLTVVRRPRHLLFYELNRLASPAGPHKARGVVDPTAEVVLE